MNDHIKILPSSNNKSDVSQPICKIEGSIDIKENGAFEPHIPKYVSQ